MRILTIEDDADFAAILNLMLRGEGFDVHSVATGEEGVELSKLNNHDLVRIIPARIALARTTYSPERVLSTAPKLEQVR